MQKRGRFLSSNIFTFGKKGVLRKNFIEMILLVLLIALIALTVVNFFTKEQDSLAKANFKKLTDNILNIENLAEFDSFVLQVSPGWIIKSFLKEDVDSPNSCKGLSCICLCKTGFWFWQEDDCESDGICKITQKNVLAEINGGKSFAEFSEGFHDIYLSSQQNYILISSDKKEGDLGEASIGEENEIIEYDVEEITVVSPPIEKLENLPNPNYIDAFNTQAFNSEGTRGELIEKYGKEYSIDPALIAAVASKESSFGANNNCVAVQKSALTGCGWPPSCTPGCNCNSEAVKSDEGQIKCTAITLKRAYDRASGIKGDKGEIYLQCSTKYKSELDRWKCIFCIYQSGKAGTDCSYQKAILYHFGTWKNYYEDMSLLAENVEEGSRS